METGTLSLRRAFRNGSWRDWPLAIGFSLFLQLGVIGQRKRTAAELPVFRDPKLSKASNQTHLNMQTPSKPKRGKFMNYVSIPRHFVRFRVESLSPLLGTHPGQLPLRQLTRRSHGSSHRLLQRATTLEVCPELSVANRAHRRVTHGQTTALAQSTHFLEKARGHHRLEAARQSLVQPRAIARKEQPVAQWRAGQWTRRRALQQRERLAGPQAHLKRSLDALTVVNRDAGRGLGVECGELGMQRRPPFPRGTSIELGPQLWGRRR